MELNTKDSGRMIFSMVMESKLGQTSQSMKEIMPLEESTESEATNGTMDQCTLVIGGRIKYPESVFIPGSMVVATKVNGLTITWKVWESTYGMTAECTKANIRTIKNMALEFTPGLTEEAMKATGTRANSMESAHMLFQKTIKSNLDYGKTVSVSSGSMRRKFRLLTIYSSITLLSSIKQIQKRWLR